MRDPSTVGFDWNITLQAYYPPIARTMHIGLRAVRADVGENGRVTTIQYPTCNFLTFLDEPKLCIHWAVFAGQTWPTLAQPDGALGGGSDDFPLSPAQRQAMGWVPRTCRDRTGTTSSSRSRSPASRKGRDVPVYFVRRTGCECGQPSFSLSQSPAMSKGLKRRRIG